ncbi:uncharacterized protein LOC143922838 [Arctopsyche grandis]|uniref:uncharacterized protein LOC143922838 n=1 Tax=Arctopsyche grandis TaxID=121162 RepID=UPI00406D7A9D
MEMHRTRTKIPIKMVCKDNEDEDLLSLSNTTSTSINERITYYPRGQNWRKMFDEETGCDITIDVDGALIRAHKSVLMSRCQYFAAMFSGKSKDSINIMYLDGFSFECVHFALCQIYSGNMNVPQNIDIFELADLADLLNLEGLKELVTHILELEYFHSFHKPCKECIYLISKFLPWSGAIGYGDIYYKILLWVEKYCDEIWPNREFALMPHDVIKKCFLHNTLDIDTENVLETVNRCEKLMFVLPKVSWTASIFRFSLQLLRDCVRYISAHLADVLSADSFLSMAKMADREAIRLEDRITAAIERANPLQVCAAYAQLHRLLRAPSDRLVSEWRDLLTRLAIHCEDALVCCASQAMSTSAWLSLQPDLQARITTYSGVVTSATYSKYLQSTNKFTRERNVERIKYILYSQLGNINRVPMSASRQHLPAPTASKRFFVAPGNSMVSSTKTTNLANMRNSHPVLPTAQSMQYKDVKPRYMNTNKPIKNKEANVLPKKQMSSRNVSLNSKQLCKPVNYTSPNVNKKLTKKPNNVNVTDNLNVAKQTHSKSYLNHSVDSSLNGNRKSKVSDILNENQIKKSLTKSVPVSYVSPYSFRPLDSAKLQKNPFQTSITSKYNYKSNDRSNRELLKTSLTLPEKSKSLAEDKRNISVSDTALSVDSKKNYRTAFNKSPTFKKSSLDYSSSYSSPISHSSQRIISTSPRLRKDNAPLNVVKSLKSNTKGKSTHTFAKSTVSSSAKVTRKPNAKESNSNSQSFSNNSNKANPCDIINIPTKNQESDGTSADDATISMLMTRSRTFLKSEPSVISKDITLDASIEMYPE